MTYTADDLLSIPFFQVTSCFWVMLQVTHESLRRLISTTMPQNVHIRRRRSKG